MVGILLDSTYSESLWCKSIYESLTERLRRKRIPFCQVFNEVDKDLDTIFVIASDREWIISTITQLNQNGIRPILICNQSEKITGCLYSCVCSDIHASMKNLLDTLKAKGKSRIALYGMNTDSISDISRVDSLLNWRSEYFKTMKIFVNNGSLQNCFDEFYTHINEFDAAICANDFAAVSLLKNLERTDSKKLTDFSIISCAKTQISNCCNNRILSLNINFDQYGKAAIYIYDTLKKHSYLSGLTARVLWSLESSDIHKGKKNVSLNLTLSKDAFYEDKDLSEMLIVDKILSFSDEVEKKIIDCLLDDNTYEQIADTCFLTVGGVKYRINKMISSSGAADKAQMIHLLKKYVR